MEAVAAVLAIALIAAGLRLWAVSQHLLRVEEELPEHIERALIAGFEHGVKYVTTGVKPRRATLVKSYQQARTEETWPI